MLARGSLQSLPQGGLGCAVHTLIVLHLWATVTVVALLQAVIEQAQIFFHLLGLVYRVRVQDLWDQAQRAVKRYGVACIPQQVYTSCLSAMRHTTAFVPTPGRQIQAVEESSDIVIGPMEGAMSMTSKGVSDTHHIYWQLGHPGGTSLAVLYTLPGLSAKRSHPQADVSLQSV